MLEYTKLYNNYLNDKKNNHNKILILYLDYNINFEINNFINSVKYEYNIILEPDIINQLIKEHNKYDIIIINYLVNLNLNDILFLLNINGILILEINDNCNINIFLKNLKEINNNYYLLYLYDIYDCLKFILIYKIIDLYDIDITNKYINIIDYRNYYLKKLNNNFLHIKLTDIIIENNINKHLIFLKYINITDKILKLGNNNDTSFYIINLIIKNNNLIIFENDIFEINYINDIKNLNNFNFIIESNTIEQVFLKYNLNINVLIIDKIEYLNNVLLDHENNLKNINKLFLLNNTDYKNYELELNNYFNNKININDIYILWTK